ESGTNSDDSAKRRIEINAEREQFANSISETHKFLIGFFSNLDPHCLCGAKTDYRFDLFRERSRPTWLSGSVKATPPCTTLASGRVLLVESQLLGQTAA